MSEYDSERRSYLKCICICTVHAFQPEWRKWFGKFMLWILKMVNCKQFIALVLIHMFACEPFFVGHAIIFCGDFVLFFCGDSVLYYGLAIRSTNKQNAIIYFCLLLLPLVWFGLVLHSILCIFCIFLVVRSAFIFGLSSVKCDTMSFFRNTLIKCDVCVGRTENPQKDVQQCKLNKNGVFEHFSVVFQLFLIFTSTSSFFCPPKYFCRENQRTKKKTIQKYCTFFIRTYKLLCGYNQIRIFKSHQKRNSALRSKLNRNDIK